MKTAFINGIPYGSTGTIVRGIKKEVEKTGEEALILYGWTKKLPKSNDPSVKVGSAFEKLFHVMAGRLTGWNGFFSVFDTLRIIHQLRSFKPDVVNLHILHCWNINLPLLFRYLRRNNIKVFWTMHDCWAFTGKCPHYMMVRCDKWKTGCHHCPQVRSYPEAFTDVTEPMWRIKKRLFTSLKDMVIITPSRWLGEQVKQSFLSDCEVRVINNGIDTDIFFPLESDFRKKYNLENQFIILGVAFDWGIRKGLDIFEELAERLDEEVYKIVLVGVKETEKSGIDGRILTIPRTDSPEELAKIYAAADVFANPTREDNFPTVNMEALACGTPVVTFRTGGSPEIIDESCGIVIENENAEELIDKFHKMRSGEIAFSKEKCRFRAEKYDQNEKYKEYVTLFRGKENC